MGKVTLTSTDCITFISQTAFIFFSNQVVLTAANGDQIFATYSGKFEIEGGVGTITGTYTVLGGTGRFSQATGAGTVQGLENVTSAPFKGQVQLTGTILY